MPPWRGTDVFNQKKSTDGTLSKYAAQSIINWRFNTQNARPKLHRLYPSDFTVD